MVWSQRSPVDSSNVSAGNNKEVLVDVITQLLPYIGYPRTLNALKCVNEVLAA